VSATLTPTTAKGKSTTRLDISPVGRVEGDLDVRVEIDDGVVTSAYTQASLWRGFEVILRGKDPQAGLIVTPRICGICGGSHLYCASSALDTAFRTTLPPNALLLRAIGQACETIQSVPRWFYAIYAGDLANSRYASHPLYAEVMRRWAPFKGEHFERGLLLSNKPLEVYALFGGQWPHSSYMVPGGVMGAPTLSDVTRASAIMAEFKHQWLEPILLGCTVERYLQINSWADFEAWYDESPKHRESDLGFYYKVAREFGLDGFGQGVGKYLAYGTYLHKDKWNTASIDTRNDALISPSGMFDGQNFHAFDHLKIQEHVAHSWYQDAPPLHPWKEGPPVPLESTSLSHTDTDGKYSWAKAPRYADTVVEVGPLARMIMAGNPRNLAHQTHDGTFLDAIKREGPSIMMRCLARLHETARLFQNVQEWIGQIDLDGEFYTAPVERDGIGFGATEAARGALAHWVEIEGGVIKNYQVMAPTTWNIGPRDGQGRAGAIEAALTGIPIANPKDPVEVAMVARSFDSCIVCTVHAHDAKTGEPLGRYVIK
jgi:hydrogenase large subunit